MENPNVGELLRPGGPRLPELAAQAQLLNAIVIDSFVDTPADFEPGDHLAFIYRGVLFARDDDSLDEQNGDSVWRCGENFVCFRSDGLKGAERGYTSVSSFVAAPTGAIAKGARFGISAAPSGAFADHANEIALCRVAGDVENGPAPIFSFHEPAFPGFFAYVESGPLIRHWNGAAWLDGLPGTYSANSIPAEALKVSDYVVESIITASPNSPTVGSYYLVGIGATGILAGKDQKIAKCVSVGGNAEAHGYSFPDLAEGDTAWNKAIKGRLEFYSGVWQAAQTPKLFAFPARIAIPAATIPAGGSPSFATPPTTADGVEILSTKYTLARQSNRLLFEGRLDVTSPPDAATSLGVALFLDGNGTTNGTNWIWVQVPTGGVRQSIPFSFEIAVGDVAEHTYRLRAYSAAGISALIRGFTQPQEIRH